MSCVKEGLKGQCHEISVCVLAFGGCFKPKLSAADWFHNFLFFLNNGKNVRNFFHRSKT